MSDYTTEDCISFMIKKLPAFSNEIKAVIDATEENATAIYELDLVEEESFMETFLEHNYNLQQDSIQNIIQCHRDYCNSL